MEEKKIIAEKVLDYWHMMEFLSQDKFPRWSETDKKKARNAEIQENNRKSMQAWGKEYHDLGERAEVLKMFKRIDIHRDIYSQVKEDAEKHGMTRWGTITLYIGKIKREACIKNIAASLGRMDDEERRPERSTEKIAWMNLQMEPTGQYVRKSVSLSPILWAMNVLKHRTDDQSVSDVLAISGYRAEVNGSFGLILDEVADEGIVEKKENGDEGGRKKYELDENGIYIKRAEYPLLEEHFLWLTKNICKSYMESDFQISEESETFGNHMDGEKVYYLSYQLFKDDQAMEKHATEDELTSLIKPYFVKDLERIKSCAEKLEQGSPMQRALLDYICSGYEQYKGVKARIKIDLLQPEAGDRDKSKFLNMYQDILQLENAPLGKWPSRYMPAFMQQTAINLAIAEKQPIFSVNGPPGTGKTTLLKEIIVHNIVERARLLAEYTDPDDAFEQYYFTGGTKEHNAYSKWAPGYYRFKNDKINDFGVLVASNNNTAVENITKELPTETDILGGLPDHADEGDVIENGLMEIRKLFTAEENPEAEWLKEVCEKLANGSKGKGRREQPDCHDIYFTAYARGLFRNKDIWGLIAAPMGKKRNIHEFYDKVMKPLEYVICGSKSEKKQRHVAAYRKARENFLNQLQKVEETLKRQQTLKILPEYQKQIRHMTEEKQQLQLDYQTRISELEQDCKDVQARLESVRITLMQKDEVYKSILNSVIESKQLMKSVQEQVFHLDSSIGLLDRIFHTNKWKSAENLRKTYRQEEEDLRSNIERINAEAQACQLDIKEIQDKIGIAQTEFMKIEDEKRQMQEKLRVKEKYLEDKILFRKSMIRDILGEVADEADTLIPREESVISLDSELIDNFVHTDVQKRTKAHISTPEFSERYNREREKLFYYALRLQEAFVLASHSCRENLINLALLWQEKNGDDDKRVSFSAVDVAAAKQPLMQTLFLVVPVISSTFASISSFLEGTGKETVGTLIIDEAGQAAPHVAAGALFRSRKAVIVGDPRQIEPVVTDDLQLLKQAYDDDVCRHYTRKDISVQHFADHLNPYGTWLDRDTDCPEWVGCPLVVHRRCISPMFELSNQISYNGIMLQQTAHPSSAKEQKFCYQTSEWFEIEGKEAERKNHYIHEQGKWVITLIEDAFSRTEYPDIFIISPFTSVVRGLKDEIRRFRKCNKNSILNSDGQREKVDRWMETHIGTVHTFQGKQADEVVFLLGCDDSKGAEGAIKWVGRNIVNVAASRAKYRLYVVGSKKAWMKSEYFKTVQQLLENA